MKAKLFLIALLLLPFSALAEEREWLEPDTDLSPPPLEEFLEQERREAMTPQERAEEDAAERRQNVLEPVRDARELRQTLNDALIRVRGAVRAYRETAEEGEDAALLQKRLTELRAAERYALSHWGAGSVKRAELKGTLGENHILIETIGMTLEELRTAQREARRELNRAG